MMKAKSEFRFLPQESKLRKCPNFKRQELPLCGHATIPDVSAQEGIMAGNQMKCQMPI
jgi:hypothetical protein